MAGKNLNFVLLLLVFSVITVYVTADVLIEGYDGIAGPDYQDCENFKDPRCSRCLCLFSKCKQECLNRGYKDAHCGWHLLLVFRCWCNE